MAVHNKGRLVSPLDNKDRGLAAGSYVFNGFFGPLLPIAFFAVYRDSRPYVSWHAAQAGVIYLVYLVSVAWAVAVAASMVALGFALGDLPPKPGSEPPQWFAFFGVAAALPVMLSYVFAFLGSLLAALLCGLGRDPRFPLLARLTDKLVRRIP